MDNHMAGTVHYEVNFPILSIVHMSWLPQEANKEPHPEDWCPSFNNQKSLVHQSHSLALAQTVYTQWGNIWQPIHSTNLDIVPDTILKKVEQSHSLPSRSYRSVEVPTGGLAKVQKIRELTMQNRCVIFNQQLQSTEKKCMSWTEIKK
jgi:hypothetical protein